MNQRLYWQYFQTPGVAEAELERDVARTMRIVLGGRGLADVVAALERNKKFLRGEVAHRVNLKFAPDLRFRVDERFDEAERIEKLLRTPAVQKDLKTDSDQD